MGSTGTTEAPPPLATRSDEARRNQLVVAFAALTCVGGAVRSATLLASGVFHQAAVIAVVALGGGVAAWTIHRGHAVRAAGHLLLGLLFTAATSAVVQRGGIGTPVALTLAAMPLIATFIRGPKAGVGWLVAALIEIVILAALQAQGLELPDQVPPGQRLRIHTMGAILFCLLLTAAGLAYESTPRSALAAAIEAERDAARAREQARLGRMERMAAIGQLAAGVAHEVNNPLTYVDGNIAFVRRALRDDPDGTLREALDEAHQGIERIATIVRDLKTFVRDADDDDEGGHATCNLGEVLESVVRLTSKRAAAIELTVHPTSNPLWARAPEAKVAQVALNLVVNAMQAIEQSPSEGPHHIRIRLASAEEQVTFEVQDDGPGMSPETAARALEPFFTTKPVGVGTGLGLSVCKNTVEAMGGVLTLDTELGVGTTVTIALPRARAPLQLPSVPSLPPPSVPTQRILVVDDDALVRRSLRRSLSVHQVELANGGEAALARVDAGTPYDVVLCDMMMPGINGVGFYRRLEETHPALARRVVFLTGGVYGDDERAFLEGTSAPVLTKPVDENALLAAIEAVANA